MAEGEGEAEERNESEGLSLSVLPFFGFFIKPL
jgi:hypothetical protein